jgi:hypothetical protein
MFELFAKHKKSNKFKEGNQVGNQVKVFSSILLKEFSVKLKSRILKGRVLQWDMHCTQIVPPFDDFFVWNPAGHHEPKFAVMTITKTACQASWVKQTAGEFAKTRVFHCRYGICGCSDNIIRGTVSNEVSRVASVSSLTHTHTPCLVHVHRVESWSLLTHKQPNSVANRADWQTPDRFDGRKHTHEHTPPDPTHQATSVVFPLEASFYKPRFIVSNGSFEIIAWIFHVHRKMCAHLLIKKSDCNICVSVVASAMYNNRSLPAHPLWGIITYIHSVFSCHEWKGLGPE